MRPTPDRVHLVLVGLMGAGKTSVGRILAERLGWPFRDSDLSIQAQRGATVRELQREEGIDAVHALEARQLLGALDAPPPSVICAAASTIDDPGCLVRLSVPEVAVVWLTAPAALLSQRAASGIHRPILALDAERLLADQLATRGPRFAQVARVTIQVAHRDAPELADQIIERLGWERAPVPQRRSKRNGACS